MKTDKFQENAIYLDLVSPQTALPDEIFSIVVKYMDLETLFKLSCTTKDMRKYVKYHRFLMLDLIKIDQVLHFTSASDKTILLSDLLKHKTLENKDRVIIYRRFIEEIRTLTFHNSLKGFRDEFNAVSEAALHGCYYLIEDLLDDTIADKNNLPVHAAAYCFKQEDAIKIMDILQDYGVDFNKVTSDGLTPRFIAAKCRNRKTYDYLMCKHEATFLSQIADVASENADDQSRLNDLEIDDLKLCLDFILDWNAVSKDTLKRDSYEDYKFVYQLIEDEKWFLVENIEHHRCLLYRQDKKYMSIPGSILKKKIFEDLLALLKVLFIHKTLEPMMIYDNPKSFVRGHLSVFTQDEKFSIQFIDKLIKYKVNIGLAFSGGLLTFYFMARMHKMNQIAQQLENLLYQSFTEELKECVTSKPQQLLNQGDILDLSNNITIINEFVEKYLDQHPSYCRDFSDPLFMKLRFYQNCNINNQSHDLLRRIQNDYDAAMKILSKLTINAWMCRDTVTHAAVRLRHNKMVELLSREKIHVSSANVRMVTPLTIAFLLNESSCIESNFIYQTLASNGARTSDFDSCITEMIYLIKNYTLRKKSMDTLVSSRPYYEYVISRKKVLLPSIATGFGVGLDLGLNSAFSVGSVLLIATASAAVTFLVFASLLHAYHLKQVGAACDSNNPSSRMYS